MSGNLLPSGQSGALTSSQQGLPAAYDPSNLPEAGGSGGFSVGRMFAAVRRFRWLILALVLVGTALGFFATHFIKPVYTVTSTIYIKNVEQSQRANQGDGLVKGQNWVELLTTNIVLDSVVVAERLYLLPEHVEDTLLFKSLQGTWPWRTGEYVLQTDPSGRKYELKDGAGVLIEAGTVGGRIGEKLGVTWNPPASLIGKDRKAKFTLVSPRDASIALQTELIANLAQEGNFLRLSLNGGDPARITRTLNLLNDRFVAVVDELNKQQMSALANSLEQQLAQVSDSLRAADSRLEGFKVRTIIQPSEGTAIAPGIGLTQPTVMTDYFQSRAELERTQRERQRLSSVLAKAQANEPVTDELQTIAAVNSAPDLNRVLGELATAESELQSLKFRYTDQAQNVLDMQQRVTTLRTQAVPAQINALVTGLRAKEMALSNQIQGARGELQKIPGRTITEQVLTRERDILQSQYANLQLSYQQARLAEASAVPDVRVLDPAVPPQQPSSNSALLIILAAFGISLGVALAISLLLDRLDKRLRYPDQVTRDLGLSILGAIPTIKRIHSADQDPDEASQVVEAFRSIRMNVAHAFGGQGPIAVTVSSPSPGDGKSLVSSNLALSYAEAGYRTLLVDGDIRRGELHRMFGTDRRPGLLDHLMGQATFEDIARGTTHKNLTLIPCGTRHHHGPELLGSASMAELMSSLRSKYDAIIVDSPPLGAGIDPFVLGTATGNMIIVLRTGATDRSLAEAKLRHLDRLPVRLLGAVMNSVNTNDAEYRYYRYVYGYTADEEPAQIAGAVEE